MPNLANKLTSSVLDKFDRKIRGKGDVNKEQENDSRYSFQMKI